MLTFRRQLQSAAFRPGRTAPSLWLSFERVRHRIIVRTVAGGATYVAHKIDAAKTPDVLGTIAGNDSVVVVCASPEAAADLTARLTGILPPHWGTLVPICSMYFYTCINTSQSVAPRFRKVPTRQRCIGECLCTTAPTN